MISWQYIAGFFDGEGYVGIIHSKRGPVVSLTMTNTNLALLEMIKEFVGFGNIYEQKVTNRFGKHPCHFLRFANHKGALRFAENILPYCVIKKQRIEALITAIKSHKWRGEYEVDRNALYDLYWNKHYPSRIVGKELGIPEKVIPHLLRRFGIDVRDSHSTRSHSGQKGERRTREDIVKMRNDLYKLRVVERLSLDEISKRLGIPHSTVGNWLRICGIQMKIELIHEPLTLIPKVRMA